MGLNSISELDQQLQKELLNAPGLADELTAKRQRADSAGSNKSSSDHKSSDDEDLLEEFKRETERDLALTKEREETRQQKLIDRKRSIRERKEMTEKQREKRKKKEKKLRKKKRKYRSSDEESSDNDTVGATSRKR